jgi:hypothetical protein
LPSQAQTRPGLELTKLPKVGLSWPVLLVREGIYEIDGARAPSGLDRLFLKPAEVDEQSEGGLDVLRVGQVRPLRAVGVARRKAIL